MVRKLFLGAAWVGGFLVVCAVGLAQTLTLANPDSDSNPLKLGSRRATIVADSQEFHVDVLTAKVDEHHALEHDVRRLVAELRTSTNADEKRTLTEQLKDVVTAQFESHQKARETQVRNLEERVARLRAEHERRATAKTTIVEKRMQYLMDEVEGLGWSEPTANAWAPTFDSGPSSDVFRAESDLDDANSLTPGSAPGKR